LIFSDKKRVNMNPKILFIFIISLLGLSMQAHAQKEGQRISLKAALDTALKANFQFEIHNTELEKAGFDVKSSSDLAHTGFFIENEDYRPDDNGELKIGVSQDFQWPGLYSARK